MAITIIITITVIAIIITGRALRHPRFFYFAVNTLLRNKAVRGKSYFVKQSFWAQAQVDYTPYDLLRMDKTAMTRVLCAYETNMPGSAAEKLQQRGDLESMLNQLEEESLEKAEEAMPQRHEALGQSLHAMQEWQRQRESLGESPTDKAVKEAVDEALKEHARWQVQVPVTARQGMEEETLKQTSHPRLRGKQASARSAGPCSVSVSADQGSASAGTARPAAGRPLLCQVDVSELQATAVAGSDGVNMALQGSPKAQEEEEKQEGETRASASAAAHPCNRAALALSG